MRYFIVSVFLALCLFGENIDKNIDSLNNKLSSFSKSYYSINKKMATTAKAILRQKQQILKQEKYLKQLKRILKNKETIYKENISKLKILKKEQDKLQNFQQGLEEKLTFVIAKSVSLSLLLSEYGSFDSDAVIEFEVLKAMLEKSKMKVLSLNKDYLKNMKKISYLDIMVKKLQQEIKNIDAKRQDLIAQKEKNKKALKKLELSKASYKKEVKKILKKQDELKKTLAKLNIIKIDRIKKARQDQQRREALSRKKLILDKDLPEVKQYGSSYQQVKTKRYRGPKTIAPLRNYTITKKYGTYIDPIYGIKIFNESISLKPKKVNAKVKTVFNGKVVFADKTSVLDNIVIIEHKNGLHTIYANLSQIAPNIRKGRKVRKGAVVGRVYDELVFEVTQKSYHINPIRLFK